MHIEQYTKDKLFIFFTLLHKNSQTSTISSLFVGAEK